MLGPKVNAPLLLALVALLGFTVTVDCWAGLGKLTRKVGCVGVVCTLFFDVGVTSVNALPLRFLPSSEQTVVDEIASSQLPIYQLQEQLRPSMIPNAIGVMTETQVLRDDPESSAVVLNYMETYIKPLAKKMEALAPTLSGILETKEDQERVLLLPQLMRGHIVELTEAIKQRKSGEEKKEVDEVQETLAEFLKFSSKAKFEFEPLTPPRPLTDKEIFGPLGCEYWGRKRIEGSNTCAPAAEE